MKCLKKVNVYDFITSMDTYLDGLLDIDDSNIQSTIRDKKYDTKFKSNSILNDFLKDMYSKKEKTTDTLRRGDYLFKDINEIELCIRETLKFKHNYKESIKVANIMREIENNLEVLFIKLDDNKSMSGSDVKLIYKSLDMTLLSNILTSYGVLISLCLSIENNIILSTQKLLAGLPS